MSEKYKITCIKYKPYTYKYLYINIKYKFMDGSITCDFLFQYIPHFIPEYLNKLATRHK